MIQVPRGPQPRSLREHADTWTAEYRAAIIALNAAPQDITLKKAKERAEAQYRQPDVQDALKTMFKDKCAFCERKRDYPHIEHFWPKATYPTRCFEWENLLLACEVCNGKTYKGAKFPLDVDGRPLFVNPCADDPLEHLEFVLEPDTNAPLGFIARLKEKTEKGRITIKDIGLNRINLLKERSQQVLFYQYIAIKAKEGDEEARRLLEKACDADFVFSAFARALYASLS